MALLPMDLTNFALARPEDAIELLGLGHIWDLHGSLVFAGLTVSPSGRSVTMSWHGAPNPVQRGDEWLDNPDHYAGCSLDFEDVARLDLSATSPPGPWTDDSCLEALSLRSAALPEDVATGAPVATLSFQFLNGWRIDVSATRATLRGHKATNAI